MLGLKAHLLTALISATLAASSAAWVQSQRYGLQLERLAHNQTSAELESTKQAVQDMAGFQKGLNDALANFQATGQRNALAQQDLNRSLRALLPGCGATLQPCPSVSPELPSPPLLGTQAPAQPYSKVWQTEVDEWLRLVQESQERLMAIPLTQP